MRAETRRGGRRSRRTGLAALLASLLLGACALPRDRIEAEPPALAEVEARVRRALIEAVGIDAAAVRVRAETGTVTLGGFVANEAERRAVLDAARAAAPEQRLRDALEVHR